MKTFATSKSTRRGAKYCDKHVMCVCVSGSAEMQRVKIQDEQMRSRMNSEQNEEDESSSDEDDGESDGADAVEYSSCQHPVILYLIFFVSLIAFQCRRR